MRLAQRRTSLGYAAGRHEAEGAIFLVYTAELAIGIAVLARRDLNGRLEVDPVLVLTTSAPMVSKLMST
jgi:hypothetical protein